MTEVKAKDPENHSFEDEAGRARYLIGTPAHLLYGSACRPPIGASLFAPTEKNWIRAVEFCTLDLHSSAAQLENALAPRLIDIPELRNRIRVFRDRGHAGTLLSQCLTEYRGSDALVMAIPAGGVPVATTVGECLSLPVDVVTVSKITLPWNTEAGYGALAYDGTLRLNDALLARSNLDEAQIARDIERTRRKIDRRVRRLRADLPPPDVSNRTVIIVDDGLASGFTMRVAVEALTRQGATSIAIAVPTGHADVLSDFAAPAKVIYCANVRDSRSFAVADAYEHWSDVSEEEALGALAV